MKTETHRCRVPARALDYLAGGGAEGLAAEDLKAVREWEIGWNAPISVLPSGEPYFSDSPAFGLPCDVKDCEVLVRKEGAE